MALSHELISQFAKLVSKDKKTATETTVYGTIVVDALGDRYVKLDGSDQLTPLNDTTADVKAGERVSVLIKNHAATITGNVSSPAARTEDVEVIGKEVKADKAYFKKLIANEATINKLEAAEVSVVELLAKEAEIDKLLADKVTVTDLIADKIDADVVVADIAIVEALKAANIDVLSLIADNATVDDLIARKANITTLIAEQADLKYANIDFSNIEMAAIEELFTKSGIIKDLVVDNEHITGELVGVTFKGDLVEAGTLKADRLVVKGSDGNYYALNTDFSAMPGVTPVEEDSIHGSVIVAKSITAEKVNVKDLVAFGATIGGFVIGDDYVRSVNKGSIDDDVNPGIYLGNDGQANVGDSDNHIKYYIDENGKRRLVISADAITFGSEKTSIEDIADSVKTNSEDLTKYIESTTKELENLQGQIDGSIMTWFYEYVPTNENLPASEWNTVQLKNNHLGDLFYDTITGYCYRWQVQNNQYFWTRITDVDVTKALADAAKAQSTADGKRRVFVDTPKPPYDVGDLWTQGASGDIMRCQVAKTAVQSYAAADWVKASKYTDDTAADKAQSDVNALTSRVSSAEVKIDSQAAQIELRATKKEVEATFATKDEVNSIEIGGRNLLYNSSFREDLDKWATGGNILNLRKNVSGLNTVSADDVSSLQDSSTVKLTSRNLIPYPYKETTKTINGITFADNGDGTITANGTATADAQFSVNAFFVKANTNYFLTGCPSGGSNTTYYLNPQGFDFDTGGGRKLYNESDFSNTVYIVIKSGTTVSNLVFKPMLNEGSTALPYTPYVNTSGAEVTVHGSNLVDIPTKSHSGSSAWSSSLLGDYLLPSGTYTLSVKYTHTGSSNGAISIREYANDTGYLPTVTVPAGQSGTATVQFIVPDGVKGIRLYLYSNYSPTATNTSITISEIMINAGSTVLPYEPYTEQTHFADENGELTISEPISPYMTVMSSVSGVNIDLTYRPISGFVVKDGKPCLNIKHLAFGETKTVCQSILDKIDRNSKYIFSGWFLSENIVTGSTNPFVAVYIDGYYINASGSSTWYGVQKDIPNDASGEWFYMTYAFDGSLVPETATSCRLYAYTRDITGDLYFRDLKLEKGTKATDWTPAPEDVDTEVTDVANDLRSKISEVETSIVETSESIVSTALASYVTKDEHRTDIDAAKTEVKQDANNFTIEMEQSLKSSIKDVDDKVTTEIDERKKRFDFSIENGLVITAGPNSIKVTIDNNIIKFTKGEGDNEQILGSWDGDNFYAGNIVIRVDERAQFGNFAAIPRSNGNLSWRKVK